MTARTAVLEHRADAVERALEALRHEMRGGFAALQVHLDQRFSHVDARLDQRFGQLDARLDQRFGQVDARLDQQLRWVITTVVTTAFAIIGANVGILTLLLRVR